MFFTKCRASTTWWIWMKDNKMIGKKKLLFLICNLDLKYFLENLGSLWDLNILCGQNHTYTDCNGPFLKIKISFQANTKLFKKHISGNRSHRSHNRCHNFSTITWGENASLLLTSLKGRTHKVSKYSIIGSIQPVEQLQIMRHMEKYFRPLMVWPRTEDVARWYF